MSEHKGWIGVDLDGTLAFYDHWRGEDHIGEPVPAMAELVKRLVAEGNEVRIFTARASFFGRDRSRRYKNVYLVEQWAMQKLGLDLVVTSDKDFGMIRLYDDRCVQVEPNSGKLIEAAQPAKPEPVDRGDLEELLGTLDDAVGDLMVDGYSGYSSAIAQAIKILAAKPEPRGDAPRIAELEKLIEDRGKLWAHEEDSYALDASRLAEENIRLKALLASQGQGEAHRLAIYESVRQDILKALPQDTAQKMANAHLMDIWMVYFDKAHPQPTPRPETGGDARKALDIISAYINNGSPLPPEGHPYHAASDAVDALYGLLASQGQGDEPCDKCDGRGKLMHTRMFNGKYVFGFDECDECHGTGKAHSQPDGLRPQFDNDLTGKLGDIACRLKGEKREREAIICFEAVRILNRTQDGISLDAPFYAPPGRLREALERIADERTLVELEGGKRLDAETIELLRKLASDALAQADREAGRCVRPHVLYKTSDTDAPEAIKDRNGEVALGMCRVCGKAEVELAHPCVPVECADCENLGAFCHECHSMDKYRRAPGLGAMRSDTP